MVASGISTVLNKESFAKALGEGEYVFVFDDNVDRSWRSQIKEGEKVGITGFEE